MLKEDNTHAGSPDRFGYEWENYSDVLPEHEEQFRRWLPFFKVKDWKGKRILDVGSGMGRNSLWPMLYGATGGYAVDIDERSLAAARQNLLAYPSLEIHRCSAYDLPWEDDVDIAFSIGVIHHLELPDVALEAMVKATKPGGYVAIWVYGKENNGWLLWFLDPMRKYLFSLLPVRLVHLLSILPATILWIMLRAGLNRLSYFRLLRTFNFSHLRSIVFDQMIPRVANYWTREEVFYLMNTAGLKSVEIEWVNEMSWAARGEKPAVRMCSCT